MKRAGSLRYAYSLRDLYAKLNSQFFGGRLPLPQKERNVIVGGSIQERGVLLRRVGIPWNGSYGMRAGGGRGFCVGLFRPPRKYWPPEIRVLAPLGADKERKVLIHEMVHYALFLSGYPAAKHGEPFVAELERLVSLGESWAAEQAEHYRAHPE